MLSQQNRALLVSFIKSPAKRVVDDLVFWYVRNTGMTL